MADNPPAQSDAKRVSLYKMKKIFILLVIIGALPFGLKKFNVEIPNLSFEKSRVEPSSGTRPAPQQTVSDNAPRSGSQFSESGRVSKILSDDNIGSRHQRFILTLSSGRTILVAHNIDIAPRISPLNIGDTISFSGVYEHNSKGGVVHWTHHDPNGRHQAGWLRKNGKTYQ
jgi:hypothetical protein